MQNKSMLIFPALIDVAILYFSVSCAAFQFRNPTANQMQVFRHFWSVVTWKKLPQFQERRTDGR